ncbi:ASCH domain-containing protein [Metasolibacillus meyeri]|uniref:ASCH domain-containing protein n=1 Tax=Metasolibacillus meyeri TaxID=1071052 RepID=UPI000D31BF61|nr:ASCH domain-containing protein [Metasolibacillus meyeri]
MKAITITQPWASLIALGEKQFETRGWSTSHRGKIAIHAGKKVNEEAFEDFKAIFRKHGITSAKELLTGAVIATANLVECHKVTSEDYEQAMAVTTGPKISGQEYRLGDYTPHRYAWEVDGVQHLPKPIPAKGKLSLWEWQQSI